MASLRIAWLPEEFNDFQSYMKEFISGENYNNKFRLVTSGKQKEYTLLLNNVPLSIQNNSFYVNDTTPMSSADVSPPAIGFQPQGPSHGVSHTQGCAHMIAHELCICRWPP